jgi:lycopene beta-cyclase
MLILCRWTIITIVFVWNINYVISWIPQTVVPLGSKQASYVTSSILQQEEKHCNRCLQRNLKQQNSPLPTRTSSSSTRTTRTRITFLSMKYSNTGTDNNQYDEICDVLVIGSGPAGRAIASLLSTRTTTTGTSSNQFNVLLADQNLDRLFPPNYGVWQDEWDTILQRYNNMGVTINGGNANIPGVDREWNVTDCYFGGSFDVPVEERLRIDRAYYRIDKDALRDSLLPSSKYSTISYRQIRANHISNAISPNIYTPSGSIIHDDNGSTIQLREKDGKIISVRTKLIIDCTGHETKLVLREMCTREKSQPPGYQIAYGCLVDVQCDNDSMDSSRIGPYDKEAMTLFDYRTDHYDSETSSIRQKVAKSPTFMYAMPIQGNKIFFEETSLVARPALSFQECKDRTMKRLQYHGIQITKLYEEEFCYIPMGGALPLRNQRIIGLGGSAAMVHPATGYHLCRCLLGAADLAAIIKRELETTAVASSSSNKYTDKVNLDRISALAYNALWTPSNIRQRNFVVYGGEYLMKQNVIGLRGFFGGFFKLPLPLWAGFLAGWPGLPNNDCHETWLARLWFGLNFIVRLPPSVALDMTVDIITYIATTNLALAQSVTPFLGEPDSYLYQPNQDNIGDIAAKNEARLMILASKVVEDVPVEFEMKSTPNAEMSESILQK